MRRFAATIRGINFDDDAIAIFNRMPNSLLQSEKKSINNWVISSKSSGNFSKYDYFFGHFLSNEANALTDWITGKTAVSVNNPIHIQGQGFDFNGVDQYLDSNINLSIDSINFELTNAEIGAYCYSRILSGSGALFGIRDLTPNRTEIFDNLGADNNIIPQLNTNQIDIAERYNKQFFDALTRYKMLRVSDTQQELYENGLLVKTSRYASSAIPNGNIYIGSSNGTTVFFEGKVSYFYTANGSFNQAALNSELSQLENDLII